MKENKLSELYLELKRQDEAGAPPFSKVYPGAVARSRPAPKRLRSSLLALGFSLPALLAFSLWFYFFTPDSSSSLESDGREFLSSAVWRSPTQTLLESINESPGRLPFTESLLNPSRYSSAGTKFTPTMESK